MKWKRNENEMKRKSKWNQNGIKMKWKENENKMTFLAHIDGDYLEIDENTELYWTHFKKFSWPVYSSNSEHFISKAESRVYQLHLVTPLISSFWAAGVSITQFYILCVRGRIVRGRIFRGVSQSFCILYLSVGAWVYTQTW
jgi:hypothetical protein